MTFTPWGLTDLLPGSCFIHRFYHVRLYRRVSQEDVSEKQQLLPGWHLILSLNQAWLANIGAAVTWRAPHSLATRFQMFLIYFLLCKNKRHQNDRKLSIPTHLSFFFFFLAMCQRSVSTGLSHKMRNVGVWKRTIYHICFIHCWFWSRWRLGAVYVCDCNLLNHVSVSVYIFAADQVERQL